MTELPDFTRLPEEVPADQTVEIELDEDRWGGPGGGDLGVADGDGD